MSCQEGRRTGGGGWEEEEEEEEEIWLSRCYPQDAQAQTSGSPNPFTPPSVAQRCVCVCVCVCVCGCSVHTELHMCVGMCVVFVLLACCCKVYY